jgi:spore coat polysaccharide biosynthesis protein SpsF
MIVGIIQARMGSTRLPGKVMMSIHGKSILELCLQRLSHSTKVDAWIVATTVDSKDDIIEAYCNMNNILCYRGSEEDVLDRFYKAYKTHTPEAKSIVRICCDNPTHDGLVVDYCIDEFTKLGVDYFSNGNEPPFYTQDGITAEVFTTSSLDEAWSKSKLQSEREHVTPFIKKSPQFKKAWRKFDDHYSFKLSVDNENDFKLNEIIFKELGDTFTTSELISLLQTRPDITSLNKTSIINEGYLKSIKEDKQVRP